MQHFADITQFDGHLTRLLRDERHLLLALWCTTDTLLKIMLPLYTSTKQLISFDSFRMSPSLLSTLNNPHFH